MYLKLVTDRIGTHTRNPGFGFWKCHEEIKGLKQDGDFCDIFAIYDDFFKVKCTEAAVEIWKNHQICKKIGKE